MSGILEANSLEEVRLLFISLSLSELERGIRRPILLPNCARDRPSAVLKPLTLITTCGILANDAANASDLFNMLHNLGGAVGIARLQTMITKRKEFHSNIIIGQSVTKYSEQTRQRISRLMDYVLARGTNLNHAEYRVIL